MLMRTRRARVHWAGGDKAGQGAQLSLRGSGGWASKKDKRAHLVSVAVDDERRGVERLSQGAGD